MKKKIYAAALTLMLACAVVGCGKKEDKDDPKAAVRQDVVEFVNDELPAISADRDHALGVYNSYFENDDVDIKSFLSDLQNTAIPEMETYITNLSAIEVATDEVTGLKDLYVQCAQKQCDAMKMVASAIEEENPEFLTQADEMISEASGLLTQYESQLRLLAVDNDIEIQGTMNSGATTVSTEATTEE
ncbi:MAG: hypothetical protein ACI39Q_00910 [Wujia sp.]